MAGGHQVGDAAGGAPGALDGVRVLACRVGRHVDDFRARPAQHAREARVGRAAGGHPGAGQHPAEHPQRLLGAGGDDQLIGHGPVKAIERYLADALSGSAFHYALVACPEPHSHQDARASGIVALGSCRTVDEGSAELGLLIEDAWQRRGLGTRLLRDLVTRAGRAGLRVLEAQLLAEQAWIAGLLKPYGTCRLRSTRDGVLNVTIRLDS